MAERTCSKCGAAAEPKLKFCRECGGLVDGPASVPASEAPTGVVGSSTAAVPADRAPTAVVRPAPEAGDATMLASGSIPVPVPVPAPETPPPPSPAPAPAAPAPAPAAAGRLAGAGDETIISGLAALRPTAPAKPAAPPPAGKSPGKPPAEMDGGDRTMPHSGTIRTVADPPPPVDDIEADLQKTFLGGTLPTPASVVVAPKPPSKPGAAPTAAPPVPTVITPTDDADDEPVHDDLGVGDEGEQRDALLTPPGNSPGTPPRLQESRPTAPIPGLPPAGPPGAAIRLEHWSPRVKGDVVDVNGQETVVGRDKGDLKYPEDPFLSKKHARFFKDGEGRLCVEDLGGLNGTFVRLTSPVKLEHRDVVVVGRHIFRFELLQYEEQDDRTLEGDPLTRVQGVQGKAPRARIVKRQEEGFRGLPYYFGTNRYVIGRTDGTHNFQRDDRMSRRHAALQFRDGDYWLEDLGSQNGTFLRIRGPRALDRGDVVMMGDQYFRLV